MAKRGENRSAKGSFAATEKVKAGELLGHDCPVKALGHSNNVYYFSDPVGQVRAVRAGEMTPNGLISLFLGDVAWLERQCPVESKRSKGQDRTSWHNPTAVQRLISACRREGFFDPVTQTRGPGIWPFTNDVFVGEEFAAAAQLVIHTGDRIGWVTYEAHSVRIEWQPAGVKLGEFVYPASAPEAAPGDVAATQEEVAEIVDTLHRWPWRDGPTVPQLVLGHIVCQVLPAALPYRPTGWIQARSGSGKSTLLSFLEGLGQGRALRYDNATAAGLREDFKIRNDARPVYLNEAEVSEDNRRMQGLIEMARYCYTAGEGTYRRGGSQGAAHALTSMFLFAAVEPPPLLPQDANRIAMMRIGDLKVTGEEMERFEEQMPEIAKRLAPKLARRVIEIFPLFAPTLNIFRKGLLERKHTPRMANTLGTLLAAAHLVQWGAIPDKSDVDEWAEQLHAKLLANRDDHRSFEGLCLMHLQTFLVAPYRSGEQSPLGEYIRRAIHAKEPRDDIKVIKRYGLAVVSRKDAESKRVKWLAVSNKHQGLEGIFKGTRWAAGAWVETLRLLPGAIASPQPVHFAGAQDRATLIPISKFPDLPVMMGDGDVQDLDRSDGEGDDDAAG